MWDPMPKIIKPGWVVEEGPPDSPYLPVLRVAACVIAGLFAALTVFLVFLLLVVGW